MSTQAVRNNSKKNERTLERGQQAIMTLTVPFRDSDGPKREASVVAGMWQLD